MKTIHKIICRIRYTFYKYMKELAYRNAVKHSEDVDVKVLVKCIRKYNERCNKLKRIPLI